MSGVFSPVSFAEGRFRKAYKGVWTKPPSRAGREIVVKECKDTYTWSPSDWTVTEKIYSKAQQLANAFNDFAEDDVQFTSFQVCQVISSSGDGQGPQQYEYVAVEDYIPGAFTKWCNNYGYISPEAKAHSIMPAFMHHSWYYTMGQVMVADLQGVRYDGGYQLTDPAILSLTGEYGPTDMGIEGMAMFFLNHQCSDICSHLYRPILQDFQGKIPPVLLLQCTALQQQVANATSYTWEMKFPAHLKTIVTAIFTRIARGEPVY